VNSFAVITVPEFRAVPLVREVQNFAVWGAIWSAGIICTGGEWSECYGGVWSNGGSILGSGRRESCG